MSKVITVGNSKGGVGKSTISTNLACMFAKKGKTLLIDADIQNSSMIFWNARKTDDFTCISNCTPKIHENVKNFTEFKYIIIDAGGRDNPPFRSAIAASDHLIIPMTPSPADLWSTEDVFKMYQEARINFKIKAHLLLNMCQQGISLNLEIQEMLNEHAKQYDFSIMKSHLYFRVAYKESYAFGQSVVECQGEKFKKASEEMTSLFNEIYKLK